MANKIKERTVTTIDELLNLIDEYSGKESYFRLDCFISRFWDITSDIAEAY